jgi:hypothetical protein
MKNFNFEESEESRRNTVVKVKIWEYFCNGELPIGLKILKMWQRQA